MAERLIAIGLKQELVDVFVASGGEESEYRRHQGVLHVAYDLIELGTRKWARSYYARADDANTAKNIESSNPNDSTRDNAEDESESQSEGEDSDTNTSQHAQDESESKDEDSGANANQHTEDTISDVGSGSNSAAGDDDDANSVCADSRVEDRMILYHGTTLCSASTICRGHVVFCGRGNTDFAFNRAFYLGNDMQRAQSWARAKASLDPRHEPAVLAFTIDRAQLLAEYRVKTFSVADAEWREVPPPPSCCFPSLFFAGGGEFFLALRCAPAALSDIAAGTVVGHVCAFF
jgi:hypothetical protein